jgi:hypothetical protein
MQRRQQEAKEFIHYLAVHRIRTETRRCK